MEISRDHSSLVRLRDHQREGPDEDESYPSRSAPSRAECGGAGRRGADAADVHAECGRRVARAHRIQPATAARHRVPADAHGGRGLPRGPNAHVRVVASDLRAPVWFHPIVPVPEAIQAGVGRRVLPRGPEAPRGFGRALRWLDADRPARSLRRCPDLRRDRTARAAARPRRAAGVHEGQGRHQVDDGLQHQDGASRARPRRRGDRVGNAALEEARAHVHQRRALPVRPGILRASAVRVGASRGGARAHAAQIGRASEPPLWKKLVPTFTSGVLYLFDLGFFERALFASARAAGAHVLMRLKTTAKVRVLSHASANGRAPLPGWSLGYYLQVVSKKRGTVFDLDVSWGKGKDLIALRLVGFAHKANSIRWYLTTVPRSMLTANQVIQTYRLRWLIGASSQGRITQSVKVRPRPNDSRSRSVGGTVAREQDGEALRQSLGRRSAKLQVAA